MNRSLRQAVASLRKAKRSGNALAIMLCVDDALRLLSPPKAASGKLSKSPKLPKLLQNSKSERKQKHRLSTAEIRAAVRERAGGVCEACRKRWGFWGWSLDHWEGGSGRRRPRQSVETCWALCGVGPNGCHQNRTDNFPDAVFWNDRRRAHCERYGYEFTPHVVHAQVPAPQALGRENG